MAITNFQVTEDTSSAAFTAAADTAVTVIYITNKTSAQGTVNIYVVPSGVVSVSENYKLYNNLTIHAEDTYIIDTEKLILESGDRIYIEAPDSAGRFNATISTIGL
jgi:uncharacterized Zn finger protein